MSFDQVYSSHPCNPAGINNNHDSGEGNKKVRGDL